MGGKQLDEVHPPKDMMLPSFRIIFVRLSHSNSGDPKENLLLLKD